MKTHGHIDKFISAWYKCYIEASIKTMCVEFSGTEEMDA